MTPACVIRAGLALAVIGPAALRGQSLLYEDTFDRASADDIAAGIDGLTNNTADPGNLWVENYNSGASVRTNIGGDGGNNGNNGTPNTLFLADGNGTSNVFVDHNFIDAAILSDGGFSVSVDVSATSTITNNGQGAAIAIGMTRDEAVDTSDALNGNQSTNGGNKMQDGLNATGNIDTDVAVSDFWVMLRGEAPNTSPAATLIWGGVGNSVDESIGDAGALGSASIADASAGGTIRLDFSVPDFNAATTVLVEIFWNDVSQGSASFPWSDADSNHIGLDARGGYVGFDNFRVETKVPAPIATLVATPASISSADPTAAVTLDWTAANAPSGASYEILDGSLTVIDSGAASASGSHPLTLDGSAGDQGFTFNLLDGASVVATASAEVTTEDPTSTQTQSSVRFAETSTSESATLSLSGLGGFPAGATYEISADNNAAVLAYTSPTSGAVTDPLDLDVEIDPSQGSVTFTVLLKNAAGTVFDTLTYNIQSSSLAPAVGTNLFSDDFSRYEPAPFDPLDPIENNDIDWFVTGMSSEVFTPTEDLVYDEVFEGSGTGDSLSITALGTLLAANGAGMSAWTINHNFIDEEIATDGGFSVAIDVEVIDSITADIGDRYCGYGIGCSTTETSQFMDENGPAGFGPRGSIDIAGTGRGCADFYASVSLADQVQVFANGVLVDEFPVDGDGVFGDGSLAFPGVRLRTDFVPADPAGFTAGSFVHYTTYCSTEGGPLLSVSSGYFKLTQTAENHVGFSCRASSSSEINNLEIATIAATYPGDPVETTPSLAMENLVLDGGTGEVSGADLSLTGGGAGVLHAVIFTSDFATFQGVPGNGFPGVVPSGCLNGVTDAAGTLSFPEVALPAAEAGRGFAIGEAVHWPAP